MSRWSEEFESHPIHDLLIRARNYLEVEPEEVDARLEDERRRMKNVIGNLSKVVAGLDPEFYPGNWLDQVHSHFENQVIGHLRSYSDSPDVSQLTAANDQATAQVATIYNLAAISRPMESQEVIANAREAFSSLSASMEESADKVSEQLNNFEGKLAEIREEADRVSQAIEDMEESASAKLAEWQEDFTENQTARAQEYSKDQIAQKRKFEDFLATWKAAMENQITEAEKEHDGKLEEIISSFFSKGAKFLTEMEKKHKSVIEIHKLVGRDSVAGGYQKSAGEERSEANRWRWISLACLAGAVVWLGFKYFSGFAQAANGGLDWPDIITASSLTAIFIFAAGYTSRQSKLHRDNEKQLRSYALETKALDPFIANLPESDQQAIKAELVRRMFGQQNTHAPAKETKGDITTLERLLEKLPDVLAQAVRKGMDKS